MRREWICVCVCVFENGVMCTVHAPDRGWMSCWWRNINRQLSWSSHRPKRPATTPTTACRAQQSTGAILTGAAINLSVVVLFFYFVAFTHSRWKCGARNMPSDTASNLYKYSTVLTEQPHCTIKSLATRFVVISFFLFCFSFFTHQLGAAFWCFCLPNGPCQKLNFIITRTLSHSYLEFVCALRCLRQLTASPSKGGNGQKKNAE